MLLIQVKVMPKEVETDLQKIKEKAKEIIESFNQKLLKDEIQPIAFGLNALILILTWPDNKGPDELEKKLSEIEGVNSAEITDVRRAIG